MIRGGLAKLCTDHVGDGATLDALVETVEWFEGSPATPVSFVNGHGGDADRTADKLIEAIGAERCPGGDVDPGSADLMDNFPPCPVCGEVVYAGPCWVDGERARRRLAHWRAKP